MDTAERQRQYRRGVAAERARMRTALQLIADKLEGREKPLSLELRQIALEALK